MKFNKRLETIFLLIIVTALLFLARNYYVTYTFKNSPLPQEYKKKIALKEQEVLDNMQRAFGYRHAYDIIVTNKFSNRLYGLTSFDNDKITIYLNKNVMQESMDYILDSVIAHEYAHALIFSLGHFENERGGHTKAWQQICQKLGGKDCRPYVNQHEVVMGKMPF